MPQLTQEQYNKLIQKGLSPESIQKLAKSKGYDLPGGETGLSGFATGIVKGGLGIARETAQMAQGAGQRVLAAVTPSSLEEIKRETGFKSLDETTPEGQGVAEILKTKTTAEKTGKVVANIASFFIPTAKATQISGRVIKGTGEAVTKLGIGISAKEAPLIQAYRARTPLTQRIAAIFRGERIAGKPIIARETALRQNIFGTESMIGTQAKQGAIKVWTQVIEPALQKTTKIKMTDFIDDISKQVDKIDDLSRRRELKTALEAFIDDFKEVGEMTLSQLQKFKEGWARFLPDKVYQGKPIAGSFREIQNIAAQLARNTIYKAVDDDVIRAAYLDYGNLKSLQLLGQRALTKAKFKGGAGTFVSGTLDALLTPVATTGGLTLYKIGKGVEFVGSVGLKTVKQIFGL